jgi:membrane-associated phospholipid phosphatase
MSLDSALYRAINHLADRTAWAHGFARFYAKDGIALFALALLAAWWSARNSTKNGDMTSAISAGVAALVALVVNQPLSNTVARARPYTTISNMHLLVSRTSDFSFASDHATAAGAVAAGLLLFNRRLGLCTVVAAFAMAVARVYVGAHYPSDVVAGLALGALVAIGCHRFTRRLLTPILDAIARTPLRPLLRAEQNPTRSVSKW